MNKLFLDCEFNGFGGKLMSMALVPAGHEPEFYCEIEMTDQLDPWVAANVVPHLTQAPVTYSEFQQRLCQYLINMENILIIADWPDDIRYFCEALITGPGERINIPSVIKFELDLSIDYVSAVPHNALHDARGIRDYFIGEKNEDICD